LITTLEQWVTPAGSDPQAVHIIKRAEIDATQEAARLIEMAPVTGSSDRRYAYFEANQINNLLRRISQMVQSPDVPVCAGPRGTLLDILALILADHIGPPRTHISQFRVTRFLHY